MIMMFLWDFNMHSKDCTFSQIKTESWHIDNLIKFYCTTRADVEFSKPAKQGL